LELKNLAPEKHSFPTSSLLLLSISNQGDLLFLYGLDGSTISARIAGMVEPVMSTAAIVRAVGVYSHLRKVDRLMATPSRPRPTGPDPRRGGPQTYTVELENDKVRVLRIRYGPHEKSVMHAHPPTVGVFSARRNSDSPIRTRKTEDGTVKAGKFMFFEALEHVPENTGDKPSEAIAIELKN
jgi:hypothetical protein